MEMKLSLAERLKDERKNRKLTMEQVEKETGVSRAAISRGERNFHPCVCGSNGHASMSA